MRTIELTHHYAVPPERLWALVTDYNALAEVMRGLVRFDGLPPGRTRTGQRFEVQVRLFGRLPPQPYVMEVLQCDDIGRVLRSAEHGMGVDTWRHTLRVTEIPGGRSTLSETVEIDAGWRTPIFAAWARFMYGARHRPRLRMLGLQAA